MKNLWIVIVSIISFGIAIPISIGVYTGYKVYSKGYFVNVVITKARNYRGNMNFSMNSKIYEKTMPRKGSNPNSASGFKSGDTIRLKYLPGYENDFLYADENPLYIDISVLIFLLFSGSYLLYYALLKKRILR